MSLYLAWIQTESTLISFVIGPRNSYDLAVFRWRFDPVLDMVRIPLRDAVEVWQHFRTKGHDGGRWLAPLLLLAVCWCPPPACSGS